VPARREIKADQRPLYNALRKMHHRAPAFLAPPPPDARRDRTQSHDLPPRHLPGRQRDPRARLLSSSSSGLPAAPKPGSRRPSTAGTGNQSRSSSHQSSQRSKSSQSSQSSQSPKRSSIYAGAPRAAPAYPYSSFDASSLAPGESFDSADSIYEL
jgi:hypothetical protein